jgi:hypothetical protein
MFGHVYPLTLRLAAGLIVLLLGGAATGSPPATPAPAAKPPRIDLEGAARAVAFSPDGRTVATVIRGPTARWTAQLRDLATGVVRGEADAAKGEPGRALFSPDGRRLALLSLTHVLTEAPFLIRLWDVSENGKLSSERVLQPDTPFQPRLVEHFAFSPDGKTLAAGTPQEVVYLWETATGKVRIRFQGGVAVGFAGDGQTLIAVTHDGLVRRFALPGCKLLGPAEPVERADFLYVTRVAFAPSGRLVALGDDWTTLVKEVATGRTVCRVNLPAEAIPQNFSSDDKILAVTSDDGTHFIDPATGREHAWLAAEEGLADFFHDGQYLACLGATSIQFRSTADVFARAQPVPALAGTSPPGVSLEAELVVKQGTYTLDLEGNAPTEVSDRIHFGDEDYVEFPDPPELDLLLKLRNTGKKPVTLRRASWAQPWLYLVGAGAINHPWVLKPVAGPFGGPPEPKPLTLGPGQSHAIPIDSLHCAFNAFWLLPGEYAVAGYYVAAVKPAPKGSTDAGDGFGDAVVRIAPVKVKVLPGKKPLAAPMADLGQGIRRPAPPGTVFLTKVYDPSQRWIYERLSKPVSLEKGFTDGTPLKEVLEFLSDRYDMDIHIDESAFKKIGKGRPGEVRVGMPPLVGVRLEAVLHVLLDQANAGLEIHDGAVWLVPLAKPQCLAQRLQRPSKRFRDVFGKSVSLAEGLPAGTPLLEALGTLSDRFDITLFLDTKAFERAGVKDIARQPVKLPALHNVRLAAVLKELLDPLGATVVPRDYMILVIPKQSTRGRNQRGRDL